MSKGKPLSDYERAQIGFLLCDGQSIKHIAERVGRCTRTVEKIQKEETAWAQKSMTGCS